MQAPVLVMSRRHVAVRNLRSTDWKPLLIDTNMERESGRKAQLSNITAAKVTSLA